MNHILYWTIYISSVCGYHEISGVLVIKADSVMFYHINYGYVTLPIVKESKHEEYFDNLSAYPIRNYHPHLVKAIYLLQGADFVCTLFLYKRHIEILISADGYNERIYLKRKHVRG